MTGRTFTMLALAFSVVAALAGCAAAPAAPGGGHDLIVRDDRLFVAAEINGAPVEALLDSAAEITILDAAFAEMIGVRLEGGDIARGTGGETEAAFAPDVTIVAAGVRVQNATVAVIDLSDVAERLIGGSLSVIVGREIFDVARLRIDIEGGRVETVDRASEPPGVRLPMETRAGLQTIPVRVEGLPPVQADFDLGNGTAVLVGAAYAEAHALAAPARIVGRARGGGVGGAVERDRIVLDSLEIAGVTLRDVPAEIDRTDSAGDVNVGVSVLRRFLITADFAENAVWLAPRRSPAP